jgi:hypothetical protein
LRAFGSSVVPYPGLEGFLEDIPWFVGSRKPWTDAGIVVEFYIVSGGLEEIINAVPFRAQFTDAWGSAFYADPQTDQITFPRNVISFTEKTRYLFQINKGVTGPASREKPDEVNQEMAIDSRPVPFSHMIYIGDGLTDIPCFSLVEGGGREGRGGRTFGIIHPEHPNQTRRKKIAWNLMSTRRTHGLYSPDYRTGSDLRYMLELAIENICDDVVLRAR